MWQEECRNSSIDGVHSAYGEEGTPLSQRNDGLGKFSHFLLEAR